MGPGTPRAPPRRPGVSSAVLGHVVEALEGGGGVGSRLPGPPPASGSAPAGRAGGRPWVLGVDHVEQGREVAERLRYLLAAHPDEAVVHPQVRRCRPAARAWARFSWCGKARSWPPPWMSKWSPSKVERHHDALVCQPGRPSPPGTATSARRAWPSSRARSRAVSACLAHLGAGARAQRVEGLGGRAGRSRRRPRPRSTPRRRSRRRSPFDEAADELDHALDVGGGVGSSVGLDADGVHGLVPGSSRSRPRGAARSTPSSAARLMMLSSMSVMFETWVTSNPDHSR